MYAIHRVGIREAAIRLAREYSYQRVLGLNLTLDDQMQARVLEVNSRILGINFLQMNNGPLFKDKEPEIIDYCRRA